MKIHEQNYNQIIENLKAKNSSDIFNVVKAYEFAREKHSKQTRRDGAPYIEHPVNVALILENLNFNTDVICSALLHDTVEDCDVSVEEIEKLFNKQVASIVDSVTAIEKETYIYNDNDIFNDDETFSKNALEDATYQKLIEGNKSNKFGFYIKFADRLNNLQTIGVFPLFKQQAKVIETKKWIIPLCKLYKTKYFYDQIQNYCFLISNYKDESSFIKKYQEHFTKTENAALYAENTIKINLQKYFKQSKIKPGKIDVVLSRVTQKEVYDKLNNNANGKLRKAYDGLFYTTPTYNIYVICENTLDKKILFDVLRDNKLNSFFHLIGLSKDVFTNQFLQVKDVSRIQYNLAIFSKTQYTEMQNGTTEMADIEYLDSDTFVSVEDEHITVLTRSNKEITIAKNSTVLDFAFRLHNEIGFSAKYALINSSPIKYPIHTKINDGDKIEIICETLNDHNVNIAKLRWLAYCKQEYTQIRLIKYFEKKYMG